MTAGVKRRTPLTRKFKIQNSKNRSKQEIPSRAKRARNDDDGGFDKLNHRGDSPKVTELVEVTARHFEAAKQPKKSQLILSILYLSVLLAKQ